MLPFLLALSTVLGLASCAPLEKCLVSSELHLIDCEGMQLESFPLSLTDSPAESIFVLQLAGNNIRHVPYLPGILPNLKVLDLSKNPQVVCTDLEEYPPKIQIISNCPKPVTPGKCNTVHCVTGDVCKLTREGIAVCVFDRKEGIPATTPSSAKTSPVTLRENSTPAFSHRVVIGFDKTDLVYTGVGVSAGTALLAVFVWLACCRGKNHRLRVRAGYSAREGFRGDMISFADPNLPPPPPETYSTQLATVSGDLARGVGCGAVVSGIREG